MLQHKGKIMSNTIGLFRKLWMINIHYGWGDIQSIKMLTKTTGMASIKRGWKHTTIQTRKFRISSDLKKVTFCGQTRAIVRISCWDNGGKTPDRYTVLFMDCQNVNRTYEALCMSSSPFHPQGFGQHSQGMPGSHLGKKIKFEQLPSDCQILVKQDLEIESHNMALETIVNRD
jgi:hypothetical protein